MVWHGFVGDVDSIYRNLDVVVVPSNFQDPFPTTIIEAGLRGVPVIGSTSGGIPEMITAGVNGWIFKTGQAMELSALLAQILVSVSYKDIRQCSRDYAADRFSLKRFIVNFESVLTTTDS
jgi:glycosyltransferase involved in cell wall biosynthesis